MDIYQWLAALPQFLPLIPGAISCYLPAKGRMRFTPARTAAYCAALFLPYCALAAALQVMLQIDVNMILIPSLALFFFLYRRTVNLDLPRSLAIYVGVCSIETFPAQFACFFDAVLHPAKGPSGISLEAVLFQFGFSCLLLAAFFYPATRHFTSAVESLDFPKIWYSTVALSSTFLILNVLSIPYSYEILHTGRMFWLFPLLQAGAMAVLIAVYVLFYREVAIIVEHAKLKEHSQLLEMQSRQYLALQEHMRQTAKLRHDFRHSVRLLASLAEQDDLCSIRAHIAEYDTELEGHTIANYCHNAVLNALFGYYHEMAACAGIDTDWRIGLPDPLPFSELDMAALFGNLIENAIAGCQTLPESSRYFCLTAQVRHGSRLYIVSTNSFNGKARIGKDGYRSTKHSGTGTGLASITAVAEKYEGSAKASNSDKEFFVDVVLKI